MSKIIACKLSLVLSIFAGMVAMDCGQLAAPAFAQRPSRENDDDDDNDERRADNERGGDERGGGEGRSRWQGRRGWGGRRGGGFGGGEDGGRRGRERQRDDNDDEEQDDDDSNEGRSSGTDVSGYARDLVKQYDKNGDMMLQEEERSGLRGPAARADLDNDNVITVEEIVQSLSDRGASGRGRRERPSGRGTNDARSDGATSKAEAGAKKRVYTSVAAGKGDGKEEADKRKSYRFTPAQERLAGNLPSWFKSRDRNKDGQVSMSEYSRSWTARLVRQFQDVDLNDDGVVTAKEAAE
jgi:hypothetical protein